MSDFPENSGNLTVFHDVEEYLGQNGKIAKTDCNFVFREGQLKMALEYQKTLKENSSLVCEAGTGTGKTFAYLLPALLSSKTILISTASKALQDQLIQKDLPSICNILNIPHNYMSLKGFSNYLCKDKYYELSNKFASSNGLKLDDYIDESAKKIKNTKQNERKKSDIELLDDDSDFKKGVITPEIMAKLELLVEKTDLAIQKDNEIDFCEVNSKFDSAVVSKVTIHREYCKKRKCKYYDECFCYLARKKATSSKVVVINHSLFFSTMDIEDPFNILCPSVMLPKYRAVVFDEAHDLPSIGREHLSFSVSSYLKKCFQEDVSFIVKTLVDVPVKDIIEAYNQIIKSLDSMHSYLLTRLPYADGSKAHINFYKYEDYFESDNPFEEYKVGCEQFRQRMIDLYSSFLSAKKLFIAEKALNEDFFESRINMFSEAISTIVNLMTLDKKDNENAEKYVGTVEVSKKSFKLQLTPLEISEKFGSFIKRCENNNVSTLFTSATICIDHKFNKFIRDIGANSTVNCIEVESNFDYKKQTAFFCSKDFPKAEDSLRISKIICMLEDLINNVNGGVFLLTTSVSALKTAYELCIEKFSKKRAVLCQYRGLSNSNMLLEFKKNGNAILIGTASFWAGVDVPGKALSLVIIDKLPFTSPSDPLFKARCQSYDLKFGKNKSFAHLCVPEAVIDLRQGAGRLIRHESDVGGLVIADPRILSHSYGKIFLHSLPKMTVCNTTDDVLQFLNQSTNS